MSEFANIDELKAFWEQTLASYAALRTKVLFYTALRDQASREVVETTDGDRSVVHFEPDSVADISRIETEQDEHYQNVQSQLNKDIEIELAKGKEVRESLQRSLAEWENAHPLDPQSLDLKALEEVSAKLEHQLDLYSDAAAREEQLVETRRELQQRKHELEQQIEHLAKVNQAAEGLELRLKSKDDSSESKEIDNYTRFLKLLG